MAAFTPEDYDVIRPGVQASAAVVAPLVAQMFEPETVIDVGCGEGWWAKAFERPDGVGHVCGVDGHDGSAAVVTYEQADLAEPGSLGRFPRHDLAVCLEVAEHLPPQRAGSFIAELCALAPVVLFSAAVPGQGGVGHVNEQWPDYWADLFGDHDYDVSGALRWRIWNEPTVENWYRQNILVAVKSGTPFPSWLQEGPAADPLPVVHPVLFSHIHALWRGRTRR